jgi:hypothetical protein
VSAPYRYGATLAALDTRRTWRRRADVCAASAMPFGAFMVAAVLAVSLTPESPYNPAMLTLAVYAGAVTLILLAGSALAAWRAA